MTESAAIMQETVHSINGKAIIKIIPMYEAPGVLREYRLQPKVQEVDYWSCVDFVGFFGEGKQAISWFETGERNETLAHREMLFFVACIDEKGLLNEYVKKRFKVDISRRYYINGTPMTDL